MRDQAVKKELDRLGRMFVAAEADLKAIKVRRADLLDQLDDPERAEFREWTQAKLARLDDTEKRLLKRVAEIGARVEGIRGVDPAVPKPTDSASTRHKRARYAEVSDEYSTIANLEHKSPSPLLSPARKQRLADLASEAEVLRREIEVGEEADRVKAADPAHVRVVK